MSNISTSNNAFVVPAPRHMSVPVVGDHRQFPVRRIYCVGRNYGEHIREMGGDERDPPFFFQKPTDSLVLNEEVVPYPACTEDFQHEVELVLAISKEGRNIRKEDAGQHTFGLSVGIDLTRRDVQIEARKTGRPWEIGKSFDRSAPCGDLLALKGGELPTSGRIHITVNGEIRQVGDLAQMVWSCAEIISKLSEQYSLMPGDLIYTGTPAGVGPLLPGDYVEADFAGIASLAITIGGREV